MLMFKTPVLQTSHNLSDERAEYPGLRRGRLVWGDGCQGPGAVDVVGRQAMEKNRVG
jgi:hypothetical protein